MVRRVRPGVSEPVDFLCALRALGGLGFCVCSRQKILNRKFAEELRGEPEITGVG